MKLTNGHCLLLMEAQVGQRTFSDYPDLKSCLDSLLLIYEENHPDEKDKYTLDIIWQWLDQFKSIILFVFDAELNRYKKLKHSEFKELFIKMIEVEHDDND